MWKRLAMAAIVAAAGWALGSPALASGDYSCAPGWTLRSADLDCGSSLVISPGADSRVNLALLLRDRAGLASKPASYPELEWDYSFGHNFVDWSIFSDAAYAKPEDSAGGDYYGSRCISLKGGDAAFGAAVAANKKLSGEEREKLVAARDQLAPVCAGASPAYYVSEPERKQTARVAPAWPVDVQSKIGQDFVAYLAAAAAFYGEDWDTARKGFAGLTGSGDPWLKETAKYMQPRVELNAAQAQSFDEWGSFDLDKTDHAAAARAAQGLGAYLSAYPKGAYAASARGLQRRVYWLQGDLSALADAYEAMLGATVPGSTGEAELIEEVDNKLLSAVGAEQFIDTPLLLATSDLMRMRSHDPASAEQTGGLAEAELASQEPAFKGRGELYQFLRANYSFYVKGDAKDVLLRIADNSVSTSHSALDFSRQILRGQALAALKDPGEEAFWRRLIGGSTGLYQRPAAELGLALLWERSGKVPLVFAPDSPVEDSMIRKLLIEKIASPQILRAEFGNAARPQAERDLALFTLLYKQLRRGQYAGFGSDVKRIPATANTDGGLWNLTGDAVPVGLFTSGKFSDTYACPNLNATAAALAKNARDVKGRLCLGEFYRLNGLDDFTEFEQFDPNDYSKPTPPGLLGSSKSLFPGSETDRAAFYDSIIADPAAPAPEKAYAYYRAIRCYAPSGNNTCGGKDVDESQRKAWYTALKRQYPTTRWAKELQYYW